MTSSSAEEYTKALRRRMISEVLQKSNNHDIWQIQQLPNKSSQPKPASQPKQTSQPKPASQPKPQAQQPHAASRMSRPSEVKRSSASSRIDQRRSQSAQGKRSNNGGGGPGPGGSSAASNVETSQSSSATANKNNKAVPNNCRPGLGRRSVTQLELSRRKRPDEDVAPLRQSKWHSQEHLDQVRVTQFL